MKPPRHSIDAPAILVMRDDPAWDHDRISAELKDADGSHPIQEYFSGATRYDTSLVSEYLGKGEPTEFRLGRLAIDRLARVQDMFAREVTSDGATSLYAVWVEAVSHGLESMNGPGAIELEHRNGRLTSASLQELHDAIGGLHALAEIGAAVFNLSQPLSRAEKKR